MADTRYITLDNLTRYDSNFKTYVNSEKTNSLKALTVKDNSISFYTNPNPDDATIADFTIDLPTEIFLDQTKTTFIQSFIWDAGFYPGAANPYLDNKPVLVLAVKGEEDPTYSFLNMETLVDIYEGEDTKSVKISVSDDNKISADVQISAKDGNLLIIEDDGLYVNASTTDASGKADKLTDAIAENQLLIDDGEGNLKGSGVQVDTLVVKMTGSTAGNILIATADGGIEDSGVALDDIGTGGGSGDNFIPITNDEIDALFT